MFHPRHCTPYLQHPSDATEFGGAWNYSGGVHVPLPSPIGQPIPPRARALTDGYADTLTGPSCADGPTCCSANNLDQQKSS